MTPRELAIIRCCAEPHYPHEDAAIIMERAFTYHGIDLQQSKETLVKLHESGHVSRQLKAKHKVKYRRTEQGQAAIAKVAA